MPLLERESALASLVEYAEQARAGQGRLVLVGGEAGVGKSALVELLQDQLGDAHWAWGLCDGLSTPRPLGPLFDLAGRLGGELLELTRVRAPREDLFGAVLRAVDRPGELTVLVVEDLHWADEATVDLLRFLVRRIRAVPVLVIATYRDDGLSADDPLRIALGEFATQRSTRRIDLARLSAAAVARLARPAELDPAELYRLTGGNPFYVQELVQQAGTDGLPPSARDAVLARAARLSPPERAVLDAAALIGARFDHRLLLACTGCPPSTLDTLLASGLIADGRAAALVAGGRAASAVADGRATSAVADGRAASAVADGRAASAVADGRAAGLDDQGGFRFRHEIARVAVAESVPAHRRVKLHGQILAALRDRSDGDGDRDGHGDDAAMAFHAEAAGDTAAVLAHAPRAARQAAELASHWEAAAQYQRALRFAGGLDPAGAAELYEALATELTVLDRAEEAAEAAEQALQRFRASGDRQREGEALRQLSGVYTKLCRGQEAADAAQAAVAVLEPLGPSPELALAYANLAGRRMLENADAAVRDLAGKARAIAEPLGVSEAIVDALNAEGCTAYGFDREWRPALTEALRLAVAAGLRVKASRAYHNLYSVLISEHDYAAAEAYYEAGLAYCDEYDLTTFGNCLRVIRTGALDRTGAWDEAVALGREVLRLASASPANRMYATGRLGAIGVRRADPQAWEQLRTAMVAADGTCEPPYIVQGRLSLAEAHWLAGDLAAAREQAELADDVAAGCDGWDRGAVAVWLQRTGSARPPRGRLAEPYRLELAGDAAAAAQEWRRLGCPYDAALALLGTGDEAGLREALAGLQELAAVAAVKVARDRLRQLGVRSIPLGARTSTRSHPLGLTRREHEVLDLICAGLTNAQIAQKLFISAKTVDHHVSAVLTKLDAPTRSSAASTALRLGLVGATQH